LQTKFNVDATLPHRGLCIDTGSSPEADAFIQ